MTSKSDLLDVCRSFLTKRYQDALGLKLSVSLPKSVDGRDPIWHYVSSHDLTSQSGQDAPHQGAVVLDPEIGLLCFLLVFDSAQRIRSQIKRAITLQSQLLAEQNYPASQPRDNRGVWRVALHWLVNSDAEHEEWLHSIMEVRKETAFSEELSLDVIRISANAAGDIAKYDFPRLLLTTREVFRKTQKSDTTRWVSANDLVRKAMQDFELQFTAPEERNCASIIARAAKTFEGSMSRPDVVERQASALERLQLRHFRNFKDFDLHFGSDAVNSCVIHGPNGTGKSSLCEAISIALFDSSPRFIRFAAKTERDVAGPDRRSAYISDYLTPLRSHHSPELALNDSGLRAITLAAPLESVDSGSMGGTVLTQEMSLEFAQMSAIDLGDRILRNYSDLAEHVEGVCERHLETANNERQQFLRSLGIPVTVTRLDTAFHRIAESVLDRECPIYPGAFVEWLDSIAWIPGFDSLELAQRWRAWSLDARATLATQLAEQAGQHRPIVDRTKSWLEHYNVLVRQSAVFIDDIDTRVRPTRERIDQVVQQLESWGAWLAEQPISQPQPSRQAAQLSKELEQRRTAQAKIVDDGQSIRARLEHLEQADAYLREVWATKQPGECPTCGADHSHAGGIVQVVKALGARLHAERESLQLKFLESKKQLAAIQQELAQLGSRQPPLGADEQSELVTTFRWLARPSVTFESMIADPEWRSNCGERLRTLVQKQVPPAPVETQTIADGVAETIGSRFLEASRIWEAPTRWKPVKEKLTATLAEIVANHLPRTLERLWCELVLNLTAAPWLLLGKPDFEFEVRRGIRRASLHVEGRLARYILNCSETHLLGLGWFFTQYFVHGRFVESCIVMDDPAHELDQTSFRELCRFWETLVRLHRVYERPLKLVIMLHQESRATEAARAVDGDLVVLGWERDQDRPSQRLRLLGESFYPPDPTPLFVAKSA